MLRFLVDNSSGKRLATALKDRKFDVIYAGDALPNAEDDEILERAEEEKRILVTNDKDFGELIFRYNKPSSGVILLRLKTDFPDNRIKVLLNLIDKMNVKLNRKFIVASEDRSRIKEL